MERSRRSFLKILGISTLGLGTLSSVDLLAKAESTRYDRQEMGPGGGCKEAG
jgi:hypothetical protein